MDRTIKPVIRFTPTHTLTLAKTEGYPLRTISSNSRPREGSRLSEGGSQAAGSPLIKKHKSCRKGRTNHITSINKPEQLAQPVVQQPSLSKGNKAKRRKQTRAAIVDSRLV